MNIANQKPSAGIKLVHVVFPKGISGPITISIHNIKSPRPNVPTDSVDFAAMKRVLRKKKYCCITIGNPTYAGKTWDLNDFIKQTCTDIGFAFLKEISRGKYHHGS